MQLEIQLTGPTETNMINLEDTHETGSLQTKINTLLEERTFK